MIKIIHELPIAKKRVFLRVDFNVSVEELESGHDVVRVRAVLPTLEYALSQEARVIIGSHLGRPKGTPNPKYSLLPMAEYLSRLIGKDVIFPEDCIGDAVKKLTNDMREGDILLLENLRFHPEEEKNDPIFSEKLASLAEVYVNDAFGTLHRSHASTVGMVKHFREKGIGYLVQKEVNYLTRVLEKPERPLVAILGGAKVADKLGVVEYLLTKVDALLIGGAMSYTFLKAAGVEVGSSLVEESKVHLAAKFLERARLKGIPLLLPVDHRIASKIEKGVASQVVEGSIPPGQMGLDIGPKTVEMFSQKIMEAKTIIWNGPMGVYEVPPFQEGTLAIAQAAARSKALVVVGGGDSASAVLEAGVADKIALVSTGGGATLACLEGKPLPGLKALEI
jgi:phosphoglycerate kinase